jgi:hypothetical protein
MPLPITGGMGGSIPLLSLHIRYRNYHYHWNYSYHPHYHIVTATTSATKMLLHFIPAKIS